MVVKKEIIVKSQNFRKSTLDLFEIIRFADGKELAVVKLIKLILPKNLTSVHKFQMGEKISLLHPYVNLTGIVKG